MRPHNCTSEQRRTIFRCRRDPRLRRGAAVVEMAVIAPIFILVLFGMLEFGRLVMVQQTVNNAAREGARVAASEKTTGRQTVTVAHVRQTVTDYLSDQSIPVNTIAISADGVAITNLAAVPIDTQITVTVTVDFASVSYLPTAKFMTEKTMTATSTMRREAFAFAP